MKKRLLAFLLASTLVCALLPITAGAVTVTEVVPCKYDEVEDFSEGLAAVELDGKWGFIDTTGKEVVPCKYGEVENFSEGLASVELNGKYGFIDDTGKEIVSCKYDEVENFSESLAAVELDRKWGFIDKTGKEVVPCTLEYASVGELHDGLAAVSFDAGDEDKYGNTIYKRGFIDTTGKEVVPIGKYDWVENFSEGFAAVGIGIPWQTAKYGFIDTTGKEVVPYKYVWVGNFSEGLAAVAMEDGESVEMGPTFYEWGFIDKTGKEVLPCKYRNSDAPEFHEGLVNVWQKGKGYGFIDKTGKEVVPCQYHNVEDFDQGLAAVCAGDWKTGKWGFIDKTGKEVVSCKYNWAESFSEGLAAVQLDGKWGFLSVSPGLSAKATNDKLTVDGVSKAPTAYKINNANYFQLRDVAVLLNNTKAQFSVDYDDTAKAIKITTGQPYQPNGKEMKGAKATAEAIVGNNDVYINGVKTDFTVYKIGGSNFFQIRDLGKALGFNVDWAKDVGIIIDPSKPYSGK